MFLNISFLKEKGNKYVIYILVGVLILVVLFPTNSTSNFDQKNVQQESEEQNDLNRQLECILSAMEGVGEVEFMITTQKNPSSLFGEDKNLPDVCGVVVVAQGAGSPSVDARISEAVKALFSIDVHKISIVKMRSQEGDR